MAHPINLQVNKAQAFLLGLLLLLLFNSCTNTTLVDLNMEIPGNSWMYSKTAKTTVDIKDSTARYTIFFKVRNTIDYRYANIYVIARLKDGKSILKNQRFQFQLANANGKWTGKGSGDLYSNIFPLLKNYSFPKAGKYEIEVEQNMRDNPLVGISDVGITVERQDKN